MTKKATEVGREPIRGDLSSADDLAGRLPSLKRELVTWAVKYPSFKRQLLADPRAVVEKELGTRLPRRLEVRVVEETATCLCLVIPRNPYEALMRQGQPDAVAVIDLGDVARWVSVGRRPSSKQLAGDSADSEARLIARAWQNISFRSALLSDPRTAVREELGIAIPEGVELKVVEEGSDLLYIVLPESSDDERDMAGAISEQDLASLTLPMVAGSAPTSTWVC